MSETVIQIVALSKRYRLGSIGAKTLRTDVARRWAKFRGKPDPISKVGLPTRTKSAAQKGNASEEMWALKDVSFDVKEGEVLGIIGRNGAGKSTLLKILSRVTAPTVGEVRVKGRIASLLEVGTGFHPELTGRENIFLNGAILGMTKAEIRGRFDEIVAFSEVEKFIDTPVKRYSSGMYVRLAFAVAAHLESEILVVDEVLAVGDATFQKRSVWKMDEVARGGRTVFLVSHNMGVVSDLTQRCIYLENGRLSALGDSGKMVEMYLKRSLHAQSDRSNGLEFYRRERNLDSDVKVVGIGLNGRALNSGAFQDIDLGEEFELLVELDVVKPLRGALMDVELKTSRGERVTVLLSWDQGFALYLEPGRHSVKARVRHLQLSPGEYFVTVGVNQSTHARAYDVIQDFPFLRVVNSGQITHWLERPWGVLHCNSVQWHTRPIDNSGLNQEYLVQHRN